MPTLEDIRGLALPVMQYNYEFIVPNLPGDSDSSSDTLRFLVNNCSIPSMSSEEIEVSHGGHVVNYAGRSMYGGRSFSAEFQDIEGMPIYTALTEWHRVQWDRQTGAQRPKTEYATDVYINVLNSNRSITNQYIMYGTWISNIGAITLDGSSSAPVTISVDFKFDYFEVF